MESDEYQFFVRANYNGECLSEISNVIRPTVYPCAENDKCELTIVATDKYDDGWDFGYISIKGSSSDLEYRAELSDGGATNNPVMIPFELCPDTYSFSWVPGNWDEENGFIINFQGEELYRANIGDIDTTFKKKPIFFEYEIACETNDDDEPGESIDENESEFNIYPNPVKNRLYIETESHIEDVTIMDIYGRQQTTVIGQQSLSINVSHLTSGIYFIKINTTDGEITKRFVKE
jgi:hypothetical protein